MKYIILLAAIFAVIIPVQAAPPETVRFIIPNIQPIAFSDENGKETGIFTDLLKEIARKENLKIQYINTTWAEGMQLIEDGRADLMPAVIKTAERGKNLDFSDSPVITSWGQIYIHKTSDIDSILDLEGMEIGVVKGDQNGTNFIELCRKFDIHCYFEFYDSFESMITPLENRHLDAAVFFSIYTMKSRELKLSNILFNPVSSYFAVKKDTRNQELLKLIDKHIQAWKENKNSFYYETLYDYSSTYSVTFFRIPKWLFIVILSISIMLIVVLLWSFSLRVIVKNRTRMLREHKAAIEVSLEEKEVLLKEIHHRVKNNLQIISSLLNLQKQRYPEVSGPLNESITRIQAMALVHESIYNSDDFTHIKAPAYLSRLAHLVVDTISTSDQRVVLNIPETDALLSLDQIIPVGLISGELILNSIKHGMREDKSITISMGIEQTGEKLRYRYTDNGTGIQNADTEEKSKSIGMELISSLVYQLGGETEIRSDAGFSLSFSFSKDGQD